MNLDHATAIDTIDAPDLTIDASSGRAAWDERGNSIWEWQTSPGVYSRDISVQQLQALEARNLCLQDGAHPASEPLWSRNVSGKRSTGMVRATELVMPTRARPKKHSGFDAFLKRLGLPA